MGNNCCSIPPPVFFNSSAIISKLDEISCELQSLNCLSSSLAQIINNQTFMIAQQGHLPMSMSGNYPTINEPVEGYYPERVTYTTQAIIEIPPLNTPALVFADMLNPIMYAIFKQPLGSSLPAYFKDGSNYEHAIVDILGNPVLSNQLVNNLVYSALYQDNYIILTLP